MKINIVGGGMVKSGGMRIIFEYANKFTERGHDVVYYYPLKPLYYKKENIYRRILQYKYNLMEFINRKKILNKFYEYKFKVLNIPLCNDFYIRDAEVVIATQWPTAFIVSGLSASKGKKFYFIQDYETWNSDLNLVDESYRLSLNRITISNFLVNLFKEKFNSECKLVLNGIDFNKFKPLINKNNPEIVITFISHFLDKKGTDDAVKIINNINKKYKQIKFICFGLKKNRNIPEFVEFYENPKENKIIEIYSKTDIFLFTSFIEGFGLPPAEAMASGCAVITSKVGAVPDYSTNNFSAVHFTPGNVSEATLFLEQLLNNPEEIKRISLNAVKEIREKLNWENSVNKFEEILLNEY